MRHCLLSVVTVSVKSTTLLTSDGLFLVLAICVLSLLSLPFTPLTFCVFHLYQTAPLNPPACTAQQSGSAPYTDAGVKARPVAHTVLFDTKKQHCEEGHLATTTTDLLVRIGAKLS